MISSYIAPTVTADITADLGFDSYFINASADLNFTLPDMTGFGYGFRYVVKRIDNNPDKIVTILPQGAGITINGLSSVKIGTGQTFVLLYYMGMWTLTLITPNQYPTWYKIKKSHTDFQSASLQNDIEIFSLPKGTMVHGAFIKTSTQFAGTGILAYTLSVGIAGNLIKYASAFSVITAVSDTNFQLSQCFFLEDCGSVTSIRANAISVGANLNQSTQGDVEFYLLISTILF